MIDDPGAIGTSHVELGTEDRRDALRSALLVVPDGPEHVRVVGERNGSHLELAGA